MKAILPWLLDLCRTNAPDVVAYEEPAGDYHNHKTDRLLGKVGGLVVAAAILNKVIWVEVWPSQVKATRASKESRIPAAAIAGKRQVPADEADAIDVWQAAKDILNEQRWASP